MSKIKNGHFDRRTGRGRNHEIKHDDVYGKAFVEDCWKLQTCFTREDDEEAVKTLISYVICRVRQIESSQCESSPAYTEFNFPLHLKKHF